MAMSKSTAEWIYKKEKFRSGDAYNFHNAVDENDVSMISKILNQGGNINQFNEAGDTPLLHALKKHNSQIASLLLQLGASPYLANQNDLACTPETVAYMNHMTEISRVLQRKKAEHIGSSSPTSTIQSHPVDTVEHKQNVHDTDVPDHSATTEAKAAENMAPSHVGDSDANATGPHHKHLHSLVTSIVLNAKHAAARARDRCAAAHANDAISQSSHPTPEPDGHAVSSSANAAPQIQDPAHTTCLPNRQSQTANTVNVTTTTQSDSYFDCNVSSLMSCLII